MWQGAAGAEERGRCVQRAMEPGAGVASVASLTMDCEDMFKEITKKLYGEETSVGVGVGVVGVEFPAAERDLDDELRPEEHITAWGLAALMQNGFPPPGILQARIFTGGDQEERQTVTLYRSMLANFSPRIDPSAEDRWTAAEEPLAWAHSRIASYNPAQRLFKCADCECVGFLARVAEHWLGTHSQARAFTCPLAGCGFASGWARGVRSHLARDHHSDPAAADHLLRDNPALDDLTRYLQRLKNKVCPHRYLHFSRRPAVCSPNVCPQVEAMRNERRPSTGDAAVGEAAGGGGAAAAEPGKRYVCGACPYATDRRDLFTRHENIHRDEKPFHCYLCQKQFNRADHVKKHFLRMHRDQPYDLNRIRRSSSIVKPSTAPPALHYYGKPSGEPPPATAPAPAPAPPAAPAPPPAEYRPAPTVKIERPPLAKAETGAPLHKPGASTPVATATAAIRRKVGK
ncbi:hypothetical protein HF086_002957 [Spodoptera exigua]|uniref:C2H2-type domain-containing protein n=1 Tax=Spodoptera exigua TaxID=7107 RepID=A0A922SIL3_SPOEX|nr:hypothetical protein HF086_002957 [Spodoptera exigua]